MRDGLAVRAHGAFLRRWNTLIKRVPTTRKYVHGYDSREGVRLIDQATTLAEILHYDSVYPAGSHVLEAGCGVGAQTVILARSNPKARFTSIDIWRT